MNLIIKRSKPFSRRSNFFLRWSGRLFLGAGILLIGYCGFVLIDTKLYQAYEFRQFQRQMEGLKPAAGAPGFRTVSFHAPVAGTLGEIELPRIGVSAMILEGTDDRTLRHAVGHISGTALPGQSGNVAIAGHRDTFFRSLRNVHEGDEITVTTLNGFFRYRVDSIKVVQPDDTQVLNDSGDDMLTLEIGRAHV